MISEKDKGICSICGSPTVSKKAGSLTQWIVLCNCFSGSSDSAYQQTLTTSVSICTVCKKRTSTRDGSLTQWIFGDSLCDCPDPKPELKKLQTYTEAPKDELKSEDEIEEAQLREVELDLESDDFPKERYKPISELGKGAAGTIFLCRDRLLNKLVAVKVLNQLSGKDLVAFHSEAKITARLKHPNIIEVLDFGATEDGTPYMVMDYFTSISLDNYYKDYGLFSIEELKVVFTQLFKAIGYANQQGVFHRDLKPSNIIISDTESGIIAKLIDFGIAKVKESSGFATSYQNQSLVGTPFYMSPDVALGKLYSTRSEIYSIGCVFFEALTGEKPFSGETAIETIRMHSQDKPPTLASKLGHEVAPELEKLVSTCLEKEQSKRFENFDQLIDSLQALPDDALSPPQKIKESKRQAQFQSLYILIASTLAVLVLPFLVSAVVTGEWKFLPQIVSASLGDSKAQLTTADFFKSGKFKSIQSSKYWYERAALNGNAEAKYQLGLLYLKGNLDLKKDEQRALSYFENAAKNGVSKANYWAGQCYEKGWGTKSNLAKAIEFYRKAARDDAEAQVRLGDIYESGIGVTKDYKQAFKWYKKAALSGDDYAQVRLGKLYSEGNGVKKDYRVAIKYFQRAVKKKNADATFELGKHYLRGLGVNQSLEKAITLLKKAAADGSLDAQFHLAHCYRQGRGVKQNKPKAKKLYQDAAERGHTKSMVELGEMYRYGRQGPKDKEAAFEWFMKAAKNGDTLGQRRVALFYRYGSGVDKDLKKSIEWYQRALDKGDLDAQADLATIYMYSKSAPINRKKAIELLFAAAKKGNRYAHRILGDCYHLGDGVEKNDRIAAQYYQYAAMEGSPEAQISLAIFYRDGYGVKQNLQTAIKLFEEAAKMDKPYALGFLGEVYMEGEGVPVDEVKGFRYLKRSAWLGNSESQYRVARAYRFGKGIKRNLKDAMHWYQKAAENKHKQAKIELAECQKELQNSEG